MLEKNITTQLLSTIIYASLGIGIFALAFWLMGKVTSFSIRNEIVEDQNVALGIIMGAVVIGLAIIIAAAIF